MSAPTIHGADDLAPATDLASARDAVVAALPGDATHERARRQILEFIDAHPDALHRSCVAGHLTGSALVIDPRSREVLLLFHAKVRRWLQPGGHADGDANLAHVALREATEETGIAGLRVVTPAIDLDVHVFHNASASEPDHLHLDVRYLVLAPRSPELAANHESDGAVWVALDDLARYEVDPGTVRMAEQGLRVLDELGERALS